MKFIWGLPKHK